MVTCACFVLCKCVNSMYKITEHMCEIMCHIFCKININIFLMLQGMKTLITNSFCLPRWSFIFFVVLWMFALRKVHIFSFDYIYIMFFLDPLFDKNLFDAFYAYQFCHLIRHTSKSMNKEVISINQEMERKINRLVFI